MAQRQTAYYTQSIEEVLKGLKVDPERGLSVRQVTRRQNQHGFNRLRQAKRKSAWRILFEQFKSALAVILALAAVLSLSFGHIAEGLAIAAVILINAIIGFVSELRAVRSMDALQEAGSPTVRVRRDGRAQVIPVDELVPGDIVFHEGGDMAGADLRMLESNALQVDESPLTGESVPVYKKTEAVAADTPLAERTCMVYRGTTVVEGSGMGVVAATGMQTEIGNIAELADSAEEEQTPFERRLNQLGRRLAILVVITTIFIAGVGLAAGQPTLLMIETAIALGVAAIPEGLPIAATLALARGMWVMARRNALIRQLTAVETLGATQVIFTDKTGTLTENRMTLRRIYTAEEDVEVGDDGSIREAGGLVRRAIEIGVLCNNASLGEDTDDAVGDPTETALLRAGKQLGLDRAALLAQFPEEHEVPFDPERMMMATYHREGERFRVAVKGAPDSVLDMCSQMADGPEATSELTGERKQALLKTIDAMSAEGLRVLAAAGKHVDAVEDDPHHGLVLQGLVGLMDPPRKEVRESVDACQSAGIMVIMVTGDAPATAHAIGIESGLVDDPSWPAVSGKALGDISEPTDEQRKTILDTRVFARVSPEQKLRIMEVYRAAGYTVAMTGDGINDVPSLKRADIGVAMGQRGTDAARQAADMVLKDDSFASIVAAVKQGRVIFANIRRSIMFMLCTNLAEILAVAAASMAGAPLPLRPLHILYLNVLTDVFPALALGVGPGDDNEMGMPPRTKTESVLTRGHWLTVGAWSVVVAVCVLAGLGIGLRGLGLSEDAAITISFMTLGLSKLWFVLNLRSPRSTILNNNIVRNGWIWASMAVCLVLLLAAVYLPGLTTLLETEALSLQSWGVVLLLSLAPVTAGQIYLALRKAAARKG